MMKTLRTLQSMAQKGLTLTDLLISTAISAVIAVGMFTAISTLQRTSSAASHHAKSQLQQARLLDYVARDLRSALTVSVGTFRDVKCLNLTLPDYYEAGGTAREPQISDGGITYGAEGVPVCYYKFEGTVYRSVRGSGTPLATDVDQMEIDFIDSGKQSVGVSITFVPRFQLNSKTDASKRWRGKTEPEGSLA